MRVLVLGAEGQLGSAVVTAARAAGFDVVAKGHEECDLLGHGLRAQVMGEEPNVVVNCAAFNHVDAAEVTHSSEAFMVNAVGPSRLADACQNAHARLLHVSTSYVFDGEQSLPYTEEDKPAPLSVYAASKLAGEHLALANNQRSTVVRVISLFGERGSKSKESGNFVDAFIKRAESEASLRVVSDQFVMPSSAQHVADGIVMLLDRGQLPRVVNVANEGQASWYEVAVRAVRVAGIDVPIVPIKGKEWSYVAPRPRNATMRTSRFESLTGGVLPTWEEAVDEYVKRRWSS